MVQISRALAKLGHKNRTPLSTAEAPEKGLKVATDAALSRLRPIPDGPDQWELCRSSTDTGGPSSLGSSNVGYVCDKWSASPNLGRNLFPSAEVFRN
jgi:hypothetical protein